MNHPQKSRRHVLLPALTALFLIWLNATGIQAQNFIETADFNNNCGWDYFLRGGCADAYFGPSAGNSYIWTTTANGTGNRYFRLFTDWGGSQQRHEPGVSTQFMFETEYTLQSNWGQANANFINSSNTAYNYVFKTPNGDGINNAPQVIIFEVQGNVETVTGVSRNPLSPAPGQAVDITATVSGGSALAAGQGVYLRYSTNAFATSTVVEMSHAGGSTYSTAIPAGTNAAGTTIDYYVFTSGDGLTITPANADWYTINLNNNGGGNYSYTVTTAWTTNAAGNGFWSDPNMWDAGMLPPNNATVLIEDNLVMDLDTQVFSLTIDPGVIFIAGDGTPRTLRIQTGGSINNGGTFDPFDGTVLFEGTGTVAGTVGFNDVHIYGGVNLGAASTINGTLSLRTGGFLSANSPVYAAGSWLEYNTGNTQAAPYGRFLEWNNPRNVRLTGSTWLDLENGTTNTPFTIAADLEITSGGLDMGAMERELQVDSNVTLATDGSLVMSGMIGGDLFVRGNLTNNGALSINNRTVRFNGTSQQTINGSFTGTNAFHYIDMENSAGVVLNTDVELDDTLRFYNGSIFVGSHTFRFLGLAAPSVHPTSSPNVNAMIIINGSGLVEKRMIGPGNFVFPIGENTGTTEFSPVGVTILSGTFGANASITARVDDAKHPLNFSTTDFLSRYWTVEENDLTTFSYNLAGNYTDADINGTETLIQNLKSDDGGNTWTLLGLVDAANNLTSFLAQNSFSIFTGGDNSILPVEYGNLTATTEANGIRIDWTTLLEINAQHFIVERAVDGLNFNEIGRVSAVGNSTGPQAYQLLDHQPLEGLNHYRIRQVDRDGHNDLSDVVSANWTDALPGFLGAHQDGAELIIDLHNPEDRALTLRVLDLQGRLIWETKSYMHKGIHSIPTGLFLPSQPLLIMLTSGTTMQTARVFTIH